MKQGSDTVEMVSGNLNTKKGSKARKGFLCYISMHIERIIKTKCRFKKEKILIYMYI